MCLILGFYGGTSRKVPAIKPSVPRTGQQDKTKEEPSEKSTNVSEIINMRQNSYSEINCNDDQKSNQGCSLQNNII